MAEVDTLVKGIKEIYETRGSEAFANARMFNALLDDLVPGVSNERKIIHKTVDDALLKDLFSMVTDNSSNKQLEAMRIIKKIEDSCGLSPKYSCFIVETFCVAFGVEVSFDEYVHPDLTTKDVATKNVDKQNELKITTKTSGDSITNAIIRRNQTFEETVKSVREFKSKMISMSDDHIIGLCVNGTVWCYRCAFEKHTWEKVDLPFFDNIVAVSAANGFVVGVKADGRIVVSEQLAQLGVVSGKNHSSFLRPDSEKHKNIDYDLSKWQNIVSVSAATHVVGLKNDGTVIATGPNEYGECDVDEWEDIVQIATSEHRTIGLTSKGKVLVTGEKFDSDKKIKTWNNVNSIYSYDNGLVIGLQEKDKVFPNCKLYNNKALVSADSLLSQEIKDMLHKHYEIIDLDIGRKRSDSICTAGIIYSPGEFIRYDSLLEVVGPDKGYFPFYYTDAGTLEDNVAFEDPLVILMPKSNLSTKIFVCVKKDGCVEICGDQRLKIDNKMYESFETWQKEFDEYKSQARTAIRNDKEKYKKSNLCQYCGGRFNGLFSKKCSQCGRIKDY